MEKRLAIANLKRQIMKQYKIKKNSLQETLIIPLYARWLCSQKFPGLFQDETAGELIKKVDYDFSALERQW